MSLGRFSDAYDQSERDVPSPSELAGDGPPRNAPCDGPPCSPEGCWSPRCWQDESPEDEE